MKNVPRRPLRKSPPRGKPSAPAGETVFKPHPDDVAVDRFAVAMKAKLAKKREQGFSGWNDPRECPIDYLVSLLIEQIQRRPVLDPVDIGNFAMMIFNKQVERIDRGH